MFALQERHLIADFVLSHFKLPKAPRIHRLPQCDAVHFTEAIILKIREAGHSDLRRSCEVNG